MSTDEETRLNERTNLDRLGAFSDGVFAIAITLLALEIGLPVTATAGTVLGLHDLVAVWPEVLTYAVSFLIIGYYWVLHHEIYQYLERYDTRLLWVNLLFLLFVAIIPFPTSVLTNYEGQWPVVLYATNALLTGLMLTWFWVHATGGNRLVSDSFDPAIARYVTLQALVSPLVFALSIALSFVSVEVAFATWLLIPVVRKLVGRRYHPTERGRDADHQSGI